MKESLKLLLSSSSIKNGSDHRLRDQNLSYRSENSVSREESRAVASRTVALPQTTFLTSGCLLSARALQRALLSANLQLCVSTLL